jgi:lipocalin
MSVLEVVVTFHSQDLRQVEIQYSINQHNDVITSQRCRNGSISSYSELAGFAVFKRHLITSRQKLIYYGTFYIA